MYGTVFFPVIFFSLYSGGEGWNHIMELEYKLTNPIFSISADGTSVIGTPAEFALVDADGNTAFLEKALKFIEDYGKCFSLFLLFNTQYCLKFRAVINLRNKYPGKHQITFKYSFIYLPCCSMRVKKYTLFLGVKIEGILRQSADVEEVKRRVRDYEKGDFL